MAELVQGLGGYETPVMPQSMYIFKQPRIGEQVHWWVNDRSEGRLMGAVGSEGQWSTGGSTIDRRVNGSSFGWQVWHAVSRSVPRHVRGDSRIKAHPSILAHPPSLHLARSSALCDHTAKKNMAGSNRFRSRGIPFWIEGS